MPADAFEAMLREDKRLAPAQDLPENKDTLLIVDDESSNLSALNRLLRRERYRVLTATSGKEGLELLAVNAVQVIISDQQMLGMSGAEFLDILKEQYPDTIQIILSGYTDLAMVTDSVNRGAVFKFLTKPWDDVLLREYPRRVPALSASNANMNCQLNAKDFLRRNAIFRCRWLSEEYRSFADRFVPEIVARRPMLSARACCAAGKSLSILARIFRAPCTAHEISGLEREREREREEGRMF